MNGTEGRQSQAATLTASAANAYRNYRQAVLDGTIKRLPDPTRRYDANGAVRGPCAVRGPWSRTSG